MAAAKQGIRRLGAFHLAVGLLVTCLLWSMGLAERLLSSNAPDENKWFQLVQKSPPLGLWILVLPPIRAVAGLWQWSSGRRFTRLMLHGDYPPHRVPIGIAIGSIALVVIAIGLWYLRRTVE